MNGLFGDGFLEQNAEQDLGVAAFNKNELEGFNLVTDDSVHGFNELLLDVFVLVAELDEMGCDLVAVLEQCREGFGNVEFALNVSGFLLFGFAVGHVGGGEEEVLESSGVDG